MSTIYLTPQEVAALSRRHHQTVLLALQCGELVGFQNKRKGRWRVKESDAVAWVEGVAA